MRVITRDIMNARRLMLLLGAAVVGLAASACHDMTGPSSIPAGGYAYTGFDSNGGVVVTGWLTLDMADPSHVTGAWHLEPVGSGQNIGPQTGDGRLEGRREGDLVTVDLNPGSADNNVLLDGTLAGNAYRGRWTYSGFTGPRNQGTFAAAQR